MAAEVARGSLHIWEVFAGIATGMAILLNHETLEKKHEEALALVESLKKMGSVS